MAIVAYRRATETIVIARPSLGGPPPQASKTMPSLIGEHLPFIPGSIDDRTHNRVVVVSVWATWCRPVWAKTRRDKPACGAGLNRA